MSMSIGDLAEATGTKAVTIRWYERVGLLPSPPRTQGNYRAYGLDHLRRLHFIRRCRDLGFPLDQVRELLTLAAVADRDCADVDRITREHLAGVERTIADLKRLAAELGRVSATCRGGPIAECRIMETLLPDERPDTAKGRVTGHKASTADE